MVPVFAKVNSLPGAQSQLAASDRDGKRWSQNRGFDVCRHVVRTFQRMFVVWRVFRDRRIEVAFHISPHVRIGVFIDRQ